MNTEIKSCANVIKCVGTISEINIEFEKVDNSVKIRGSIVLLVNDSYIRFNLFSSKMFSKQYYTILETVGIPYSFISCIDKDSYKLSKNTVTVGMFGTVKIVEGKTVLKRVDLFQSDKPSKLFVIANMDEYGNKITYMDNSNLEPYIEANIQGIPYQISNRHVTFISTNKDSDVSMLKFRYDYLIKDNIKAIELGSICDLKLEWDKGYDISDNVVTGSKTSGFRMTDIRSTGYVYETSVIRNLIKIYNIKKGSK